MEGREGQATQGRGPDAPSLPCVLRFSPLELQKEIQYLRKVYLSLHRGRKQLLQHHQSVLSVQRSMALLQQELQVRTRLLKVGTPSLFTWLLCATSAILGGKGLGLGDCVEGEDDLPGPLQRKSQTSKGGQKTLCEVVSLTEGRERKGLAGGGPGYHSEDPAVRG